VDDELEVLLKNLHLSAISRIITEELKLAEKQQLAYRQFILKLLRAEWQARQESALRYRIKTARLPEQLALETFPFKIQTGVKERQIKAFASLEFIDRAENIVLIGPTAVGKTGLAIGLLLKALHNGYRGLFIRAQDLFDEMYASLADRSTRRLLNTLARVPLLVIDEMGYLNVKPEHTNVFFRLIEERHRRRATIITTNLDYDDWHTFLGNKQLVTALLSRLRHQCHTVRIDGPSLRKPTG